MRRTNAVAARSGAPNAAATGSSASSGMPRASSCTQPLLPSRRILHDCDRLGAELHRVGASPQRRVGGIESEHSLIVASRRTAPADFHSLRARSGRVDDAGEERCYTGRWSSGEALSGLSSAVGPSRLGCRAGRRIRLGRIPPRRPAAVRARHPSHPARALRRGPAPRGARRAPQDRRCLRRVGMRSG